MRGADEVAMRLIDVDLLLSKLEAKHYTRSSLQLIKNEPTVEAIPISWIKKWIESEPLGVDSMIAPENAIYFMLKVWEKENETN